MVNTSCRFPKFSLSSYRSGRQGSAESHHIVPGDVRARGSGARRPLALWRDGEQSPSYPIHVSDLKQLHPSASPSEGCTVLLFHEHILIRERVHVRLKTISIHAARPALGLGPTDAIRGSVLGTGRYSCLRVKGELPYLDLADAVWVALPFVS